MQAPSEIVIRFDEKHLKIVQRFGRNLSHAINELTPEAFLKRLEGLREHNLWLAEQRSREKQDAQVTEEALKKAEAECASLKGRLEACEKALEIKKNSCDRAFFEVERLKLELQSWKFDKRTAASTIDSEKYLRKRDKEGYEARIEILQDIIREVRDILGVPLTHDIRIYATATMRAVDKLCHLWLGRGSCSRCPCRDTCPPRMDDSETKNDICRKTLRAWALKEDTQDQPSDTRHA